jgi:ABC-type phosphate transport system substrate-binding protein
VAALILCVAVMLGAVSAPAASAPSGHEAASTSHTVWLCRPALADDPCTTSSASTAVSADGSTKVTPSETSTTSSKFDCFYVYPTVSTQRKDNANLTVQAGEIGTAVAQASRVLRSAGSGRRCIDKEPPLRWRRGSEVIQRRISWRTPASCRGGRVTWPTTTTRAR